MRAKQAVGPSGPLLAIEVDIGLITKLHAVAPGGPPEGQCKKKQENWVVTDNSFRT